MTEPTPARAPRLIDLDAAREARAATTAEPIAVLFQGETFTIPGECPVLFLDLIVEDRIRDGFAELFSAEDAARFWELRPSLPDIEAFAEGIAREYGIEGGLGNLAGSGPSS